MHALLLKQQLLVSFLLVLTGGVTMGPQGPQLREGGPAQAERSLKDAHFQAI